jgi:hypothetical protein
LSLYLWHIELYVWGQSHSFFHPIKLLHLILIRLFCISLSKYSNDYTKFKKQKEPISYAKLTLLKSVIVKSLSTDLT